MSGHNHYYARCVVNNVHYVTAAGGGAPLYYYEEGYPHVVRVDISYHFLRYEIFKKQLVATAIRWDGSIIEHFAVRSDGTSISIFMKGDSNGDGSVGLEDVIVSMRAAGGENQDDIYTAADVNGDMRIGLAEAVHVMRSLSGLD